MDLVWEAAEGALDTIDAEEWVARRLAAVQAARQQALALKRKGLRADALAMLRRSKVLRWQAEQAATHMAQVERAPAVHAAIMAAAASRSLPVLEVSCALEDNDDPRRPMGAVVEHVVREFEAAEAVFDAVRDDGAGRSAWAHLLADEIEAMFFAELDDDVDDLVAVGAPADAAGDDGLGAFYFDDEAIAAINDLVDAMAALENVVDVDDNGSPAGPSDGTTTP